ncbi:hypothetical protein TRFO_07312 [Tritrichomonas foetus]|uniref:Uncharacterized protein n=1 Tax=Tritrichomonas foetus TaxID=1144522 RepID=A0A1J4JSJ6_9EUKA|nr:hypothetical protein TRFO_07312 [Tritrichomonas foetus]|eukprot:OHT02111.1 hypothetical protein TRFO_07312 [Tritrichomonas foetus]
MIKKISLHVFLIAIFSLTYSKIKNIMACACNLKNYGSRTLVGNWFEERITLDKHFGPGSLQLKDMDLECQVKPFEVCPKWEMDHPSIKTSQYQEDTDIRHLEERNQIHRRINTANARRRLQGTGTLALEGIPGSTCTPSQLTHQFIDPHKMRFKTTYQKAYCRPETEMRCRGPGKTGAATSRMPPRIACTDSTWSPGWREK